MTGIELPIRLLRAELRRPRKLVREESIGRIQLRAGDSSHFQLPAQPSSSTRDESPTLERLDSFSPNQIALR